MLLMFQVALFIPVLAILYILYADVNVGAAPDAFVHEAVTCTFSAVGEPQLFMTDNGTVIVVPAAADV